MSDVIWKFRTKNFTVEMIAEPTMDWLDLSWDDDGTVAEGLDSGRFVAFDAHCVVRYRGAVVGEDWLGQCIYESPDEFRDHVGLAIKSREDGRNYGSYFADMVREAIGEARKALSDVPKLRTA